ncbi:tRNA (adenosine(37)-N6)-threonylcarbamoyltransferase complex ATPase subunit type 1 TsaE [Candidatus Berkelbacteria bacterium]|nr:tRNA (adenosine(37)-N6)-threonylcarbamoyltransferase complex ATPase subunit type 1 TsaE [Candidatus Berkelbacteria bacterium]
MGVPPRTIRTLDDLRAFAATVVAELVPGDVVTLQGELGVGKTAFVKAAAAAFGVTEDVISPTFVYEQRYTLPEPVRGITHLIHLDLYRLSTRDDLVDLGLEPHTATGVTFVEWPERVPEIAATRTLAFVLNADGTRTVTEDQA